MTSSSQPPTQGARICIDLSEPYAVQRWCERLRCTRRELAEAVRCVGNSVRAIKVYLRA